jgi:hypothetical protein
MSVTLKWHLNYLTLFLVAKATIVTIEWKILLQLFVSLKIINCTILHFRSILKHK